MKHPIAKTKNNVAVYVDLVNSQAAVHIAQQPYLLGLVKELLGQLKAEGPRVRVDQNMGRNIGYNYVVETTEKDTILYAQRLHDETFTRFVKNGMPRTTQYLTVILERDEDGSYQLQDTWVGRLSPPRPGSQHETTRSKPFWATHAFVLDGQAVQLRTVTKVCPYEN